MAFPVSDPIVGIDLGTSNTVVAHADATGIAVVLADASGIKICPSVVSFHPSGGVVVGAAAKQRKVIDPKNTIYSVKRLIGSLKPLPTRYALAYRSRPAVARTWSYQRSSPARKGHIQPYDAPMN